MSATDIIAKANANLSQIYQGLGLDPSGEPPQDNPPAATPPIDPAAAANAPEPPHGQGQAQPPAAPPQAQGQAQIPANQLPEPTNDYLKQIEDLKAQVERSNQNFANLRSYADRVAGENARLKRGQAVSSLKPDVQPGTGNAPAPGASQPGTPPQQPSPLEAIEASIKKAEEVAVEYPEVMAPVIETLRMQQQVISSLHGKVDPIAQAMIQDEEARQIEERERLAKRHNDTIRDAHKDYDTIVQQPDFPAWVQSLQGDDYDDAVRIVQHGTAYEVIGLLHKFKARSQQQITPPPPNQQQQLQQQRAEAAARDNEGRVLSTPPISPGNLNQQSGVLPLSFIRTAAKDPALWAKHRDAIEYAQANGLIDFSQ